MLTLSVTAGIAQNALLVGLGHHVRVSEGSFCCIRKEGLISRSLKQATVMLASAGYPVSEIKLHRSDGHVQHRLTVLGGLK